jgi:lipoyl(octanoyl) transferase
MTKVYLHRPGLIAYKKAWDLQKEFYQRNFNIKTGKVDGETSNHLFLLQHPHVYTLGNSGDVSNLLLDERTLEREKIDFFRIERGGDITYHGPGQIVGYPVFDLDKLEISIKDFIHNIEEILIRTVAHYGVEAARIEGATGVWVDAGDKIKVRKIAAIGMKISKKVSMHGFALNVNTDLKYFDNIIPCGIRDKGVTSLAKETGKNIHLKEVEQILIEEFLKIFGIRFLEQN